MARIELEITGNATGLENASKKAATAVGGLTKSTAMSKAQIEAWDAAARRNQMEQYGNDAKRATNNVNNLSQAQRKLTGTTQGLTTGIRGANTVGIEFSRIIQDAPYGVIGVGNNITQLTQNFANLRAQTGSTSQALGIAFRSMFSGANLLVLGVSAATTAFTLYNMWARKNKKETEELDASIRKYIESLDAVTQAQLGAANAADKDLIKMQSLRTAIEDVNVPMQARINGVKELRREFPEYFKGISDETILNGQAAESYDQLTKFIIASAQARKYADQLADTSFNRRGLEQSITENMAIGRAANAEQKRLQAIIDAETTIEGKRARQIQYLDKIRGLKQQQVEAAKEVREAEQQLIGIVSTEQDLIEQINKSTVDLLFNKKEVTKEDDKAAKAAESLAESLRKLTQESIQASLSGYEKELQASQHKYDELRRQADEYYRQGKVSAKEYADYIARLQGFRVGEAGRITGGAQRVPLSGPSRGEGQVVAAQLPNQVAKVVASDPVWDAFVDDLDKQLGRAVHSFGRDFMRTLTTINQQAGVTFGGVVSGLIGSLTDGLTEVMSTVFSKQLGEAIQGAFGSGGLGKGGTYGAAGAAILGSIVSGSTKRTSTGGQALGGALTGAGTGAALGSVVPGLGTAVGAVVGAVVGALGGIFGASSAKKQEKAQEAMLAEQRKQTALLERQNALTYASSIIGQMTSGGIVSGLMRDAFGQLVATVKGSDLQFVLQRAGGSR